jgi:hypothetical protein
LHLHRSVIPTEAGAPATYNTLSFRPEPGPEAKPKGTAEWRNLLFAVRDCGFPPWRNTVDKLLVSRSTMKLATQYEQDDYFQQNA